jgi:hypothetical protein
MRQIKINSVTGSEIVSVSEFKSFARISNTLDDTLIGSIIVQARIWCENYISRDIVAKNRTYYIPETNGIFDLPFGPIESISSIHIEGTAYTDYTIDGLDNETIDLDGPAEKVKIVYVTSGLDDKLLEQSILQLSTTLYDNRSDFEVGKEVTQIPSSTKTILNSYKNMFI